MKPLVIYHKNCCDGFGAAYAAWLKFGDQAEYLALNYNDPIPFDSDTIKGREVYILDFSFKVAVMQCIIQHAAHVYWLDHHRSAFEMWAGDERELFVEETKHISVLLDNARSGALIAWEFFHPTKPVPEVFYHIDDYDRWQFKREGTKEIHSAIRAHPFDFWLWDEWVMNDGVAVLRSEGEAIERYRAGVIRSLVGAAQECRIVRTFSAENMVKLPLPWLPYGAAELSESYAVAGLVTNCPAAFSSDVGHELANKGGTFGLLWQQMKDGSVNCSLRSNGDYDVSAIAKAFGGGGHKNAAGFSATMETLQGWVK